MSHGAIKCVMLAIMITFGMNSPAYCQLGRFGVGVGGKIAFLQNERVQKELGIEKNDPKIEKIKAISQSLVSEIGQLLRTSPKEEIKKTRETINKWQAKSEQEAEKLLTPEQKTRLQQIHWQARGISALTEPEVAKALDLSADQQEKLVAAKNECDAKQEEIFSSANKLGTAKEEVMKQLDPVIVKWQTMVDSTLSESQKLKFEELKGKPFDLKNSSKTPTNAPKK